MKIEHERKGDDGGFYVEQSGEHLADMFYTMRTQSEMNIYHTHVSEELKGQNIGQQLVEAGVAYARQHQLKIIPSCSYARTVFARHKELQDVLA